MALINAPLVKVYFDFTFILLPLLIGNIIRDYSYIIPLRCLELIIYVLPMVNFRLLFQFY